MKIQMHENTEYRSEDLVGKLSIPTIVSKQGSRIVYQLNLMFRQITSLFDHMPVKESKKDEVYQEVDLAVLRNRFVKADKVQEIVQYVSENRDNYILPPISAVTDKMFSFHPYNNDEIIERMGEQYNLVRNPHLIEEVLDEFDNMLQGMLIVKESDFNIEIMDGNHRCASIHRLAALGKEYKDLRIGVQIFYENDLDRQRQAFVDLNTSTQIDKTLLTLFGTRDPLSVAAKETIGSNEAYRLEEFDINSPNYIGFDMVNDSISQSSTACLTLNVVKNMLIKFALGESGTKKKFAKEFTPGTEKYHALLSDFALYLRTIFSKVEPFNRIKQLGIQCVPDLRKEYVSLNASGLYLMANIAHLAKTNGYDLKETALRVSGLDWRRELETSYGQKEVNAAFLGGLLNEKGNVSNNRVAQVASLKHVSELLNVHEKLVSHL